ncbi:GapS4a family protein [Alteromonas australica]|uniref:GAPS4 PD-(D/E)XK nuclease domain-containing protein n=1 Tax=Alteromonas australica TaxID=589873 RepID=A0A075NVK7_9ALTE|nr:hypothetical protein [Alteromonas australica]AIF97448.1 hypothetical protein EP13_01330 [Alteromonas australica]
MGEFSKKVGEHGEALVKEFLTLIGWTGLRTGVEIRCKHPQKHERTKGSGRNTHGVDILYSARSQLQDFTLDNVCCSVKFTSKAYPNHPNTKFREHFKDLAHCIECYSKSEVRNSTIIDYNGRGVKRTNDVGVLFWLTNDNDSYQDVVSKVANIVIDKNLTFSAIYLVDNSRAAFIYDSISFLKNSFKEHEINFHYSFTAANYTDTNLKRYGKALPVEYLTSDILPFRLISEKDKSVIFCVVIREKFSKENLERLMNFVSDVSQEFTKKFKLLFPDYNALEHEDTVETVKGLVQAKEKDLSIEVSSYNSDFRGQ